MTKMKYESPGVWSKEDAARVFSGHDNVKIPDALLGIVNSVGDYEWVVDQCLSFLDSKDEWVAKTAIICLGHIARIHRKIDRKKVIPALEKAALRDELSENVENALEDIEMFVAAEE